jgi:protein-disulfide isomerase
MSPLSRRIVLAAAALALAAGPVLGGPAAAGVPAEAVNGDMSLGNPKAPVQVVEYASAACPHCANFNLTEFPTFKKVYVDTGKVHWTLKEMLTDPAEVAAAGFLVSRCGGRTKYFTILDQVFRSQATWREGNIGKIITDVGVANGLTVEQVDSCLTDPKALAALNARVASASDKDKVHSTPTFFVNGKQVDGIELEDLDKAVSAALKARPAHRTARKGKRP